jgi:type I restriction enzyme S subunit
MAVKLDAFLLLKIRVPSDLSLQKEISDTLSSAQQEIELLKQLADKYKAQKRGLMQKLLTGQWRIKPDVVNQYKEA